MNLTVGQHLGRLIDDALLADPAARALRPGRSLRESVGQEFGKLIGAALDYNNQGVDEGRAARMLAMQKQWEQAKHHATVGVDKLAGAHLKVDAATSLLATVPQVGVIPEIANWIGTDLAPVVHENQQILQELLSQVLKSALPAVRHLTKLQSGPTRTDSDHYTVSDSQIEDTKPFLLKDAGRPLAFACSGLIMLVLVAWQGPACAKLWCTNGSDDRGATLSELEYSP